MDYNSFELNESIGTKVGDICRQRRKDPPFLIFEGGSNPHDFSFTILLLEMSIVLILSHLLHFLLKPLKQPKVISGILVSLLFYDYEFLIN